MPKKKIKPLLVTEKLIRGIKLGRQKMLEEKSLKGQYVVYYDDVKGKIIKESARNILKRERIKK